MRPESVTRASPSSSARSPSARAIAGSRARRRRGEAPPHPVSQAPAAATGRVRQRQRAGDASFDALLHGAPEHEILSIPAGGDVLGPLTLAKQLVHPRRRDTGGLGDRSDVDAVLRLTASPAK